MSLVVPPATSRIGGGQKALMQGIEIQGVTFQVRIIL
jgi:hypothetical protein